MNSDRLEGSFQQAKGNVKEFAGKAVGDAKLEAEGKVDKVTGKAQNLMGGISDTVAQVSDAASGLAEKGAELADNASRQVKTFASELERMGRNNPLMAIGAAVFVGVIVGMLGRSRS